MKLKLGLGKVVACMAIAIAGVAHAQIPVTDAAHIATDVAHQVETLGKWTQQFQQLEQQIRQYQQQYQAITGPRGMGALLDNPSLKSMLPPEWQNLVTQVKKTSSYFTERQKYPTTAGLPNVNAMYDTMASQSAVMKDLYSKSNDRIAQIQSLMGQIDFAVDPAAKQDLTNRLINEQNAIQANQNLANILQARQKQELDQASYAASKEILCKQFKSKTCS